MIFVLCYECKGWDGTLQILKTYMRELNITFTLQLDIKLPANYEDTSMVWLS